MGIKSLASILMKHLTDLGDNWPLYYKPAMLVYNSYATPNLDNLSPFEVAIGRKALLAPRFEYKPRVPITGTHAKAQENLKERLLYFIKRLDEFRSNRMPIMNKDRQHYVCTVYLFISHDCYHVPLKLRELNGTLHTFTLNG